MTKLIVTNTEGETREIEAEVGLTVMENIRDNDFDDLAALCGGCCSCCTCHVFVDEEWLDNLRVKYQGTRVRGTKRLYGRPSRYFQKASFPRESVSRPCRRQDLYQIYN